MGKKRKHCQDREMLLGSGGASTKIQI
uniref:Uncharacterized protein n=1 Tax=Rhizophora mucronata TaxID=61149 RepID=A0A2P2PE64_RHIMU